MKMFRRLRWLAKALFYGVEFVLAVPVALSFILLGWIGILTERYAEVSQLAAQLPFYFGEHVRYLYYKATLKRVGNRVTFKFGSFCQYHDISIGNRVWIGYYDALAKVDIGSDVLIGGFVSFTSGRMTHSFENADRPINQQKGVHNRICIGNDVWIGLHSVIMADVGNRVVVGAGSVVVRPLEDHSVYAGNPAELIRKI
jgi:virginiamycin A acetyltransferase